jgi:hypothetical protein
MLLRLIPLCGTQPRSEHCQVGRNLMGHDNPPDNFVKIIF